MNSSDSAGNFQRHISINGKLSQFIISSGEKNTDNTKPNVLFKLYYKIRSEKLSKDDDERIKENH